MARGGRLARRALATRRPGSSCAARSTARWTGCWTPGAGWRPSRPGRMDRSADYRQLAALLVEHPDAGPELFHLAFGMTSCRHLGGVDEDPDQDPGAHQASWWDTLALLLDRTLRLPSARSGQGRTQRNPRHPPAARARRRAGGAEAERRRGAARAPDRPRRPLPLRAGRGRRLGAARGRGLVVGLRRAARSGPGDRGPWRTTDVERELAVGVTLLDRTAVITTPDGRWGSRTRGWRWRARDRRPDRRRARRPPAGRPAAAARRLARARASIPS